MNSLGRTVVGVVRYRCAVTLNAFSYIGFYRWCNGDMRCMGRIRSQATMTTFAGGRYFPALRVAAVAVGRTVRRAALGVSADRNCERSSRNIVVTAGSHVVTAIVNVLGAASRGAVAGRTAMTAVTGHTIGNPGSTHVGWVIAIAWWCNVADRTIVGIVITSHTAPGRGLDCCRRITVVMAGRRSTGRSERHTDQDILGSITMRHVGAT